MTFRTIQREQERLRRVSPARKVLGNFVSQRSIMSAQKLRVRANEKELRGKDLLLSNYLTVKRAGFAPRKSSSEGVTSCRLNAL